MENNNVYVFLGNYCGECNYEFLHKLYYKKKISVSNSEYERVIFEAFLHRIESDCIFLSAPNIGKWPTSSKKIKFNPNHLLKMEKFVFCKYICALGLNNFSKTQSLLKEFKKLLTNCSPDKNIHVIAFEAHLPYLNVIKYAKRKGCKTTLIVPDLPEHMLFSNNFFYRILKKINVNSIYNISNKYVDSFLFFTNDMTKRFNCSSKKVIVREGVIERFCFSQTNNHSKIQCTYIGKTDERNGVKMILEAAKYLPDFEFNIYGSGELDTMLQSNIFSNINYFGFCSPSEVSKIIMDSDILLSPRIPGDEYTYFSFPSKVLKYASFAKPIVTFKLPCYRSEFEKVLFYPKNVSIENFVATIAKASRYCNADRMHLYEEVFGYLLQNHVVDDLISII